MVYFSTVALLTGRAVHRPACVTGASPSGGPGAVSQPPPDDFLSAGWRERPASTEDWLTEDEWVAWLASMHDEDPR